VHFYGRVSGRDTDLDACVPVSTHAGLCNGLRDPTARVGEGSMEPPRTLQEDGAGSSRRAATERALANCGDTLEIVWSSAHDDATAAVTLKPLPEAAPAPSETVDFAAAASNWKRRGEAWSQRIDQLTSILPGAVSVQSLDLKAICAQMGTDDPEFLHCHYRGGALEKLSQTISRHLPTDHALEAVEVDDGEWNVAFHGDRDQCYFDCHVWAALQHHQIRKATEARWSDMMMDPGMRSSGGCVGDGQGDVLNGVFSEISRLLPQCPRLESICLDAPANRFYCNIMELELDEIHAYGPIADYGDGYFVIGDAAAFRALADTVRALPPAHPLRAVEIEGRLFHYSCRPRDEDENGDEEAEYAWPDLLKKSAASDLSAALNDPQAPINQLRRAMEARIEHEEARLDVYVAVASRSDQALGGSNKDVSPVAVCVPSEWPAAVTAANQVPPEALTVAKLICEKSGYKDLQEADLCLRIAVLLAGRGVEPVVAAASKYSSRMQPVSSEKGDVEAILGPLKDVVSKTLQGELAKHSLKTTDAFLSPSDESAGPSRPEDQTIRAVLNFIVPGTCKSSSDAIPMHPAALFAFAVWQYLIKEVLEVFEADKSRFMENHLWAVERDGLHTVYLWERLPKDLCDVPDVPVHAPLRLLMSMVGDSELRGTLFPSLRRQFDKADGIDMGIWEEIRLLEPVYQWAMEQIASTPDHAEFMSKVVRGAASTEPKQRLRALGIARWLVEQSDSKSDYGSTVARRLSILLHAYTHCDGKALQPAMRKGLVANLVIAVAESAEGDEEGESPPSFEQINEQLVALRDALEATGLTPTPEEANMMDRYASPGIGVCRAKLLMLRTHLEMLHATIGWNDLKRKAESQDSAAATSPGPEKRPRGALSEGVKDAANETSSEL
jgi:hypothetical protein